MKNKKYIFFAILAAVLYAINIPLSDLLLKKVSPTMMAGLLYLGAGIGMLIVGIIKNNFSKEKKELHLSKKEMPYIIGMILLDILAPICLMIGIKISVAANVSLLNNFEIVATSLIALFIFKEKISKKLWVGIGLITIASILLSVDDISSLSFSYGSLFVILACICWGFENNCTRMLSQKDPLEVVVLKGFGSGIGSLIIAFSIGESMCSLINILFAMLLGFVAYGLSIFFYVYAQRKLGAAKTSAYYAVAPFIGVIISFVIFKTPLTISFVIALLIMIVATYYVSTEN